MQASIYKKVYSPGNVSVYARGDRKPKWRANIKEGVTTDVLDDRGLTVMVNGKPKTKTTWRAISRTLDAPCAKSSGGYSGKRAAKEELAEWRAQLEAEAEEEYQRAQVGEPEVAPSLADKPIDEYFDLYFSEKLLDGLEESTITRNRQHAKGIVEYLKGRTIGEVDKDAVVGLNRAMIGRGLSDTTRAKRLKILRAAWRAHAEEIGRPDPFDGFAMPSSVRISPNPLTEGCLDDLLNYLERAEPTPFNVAVELALRTGARRGEVCGLRWRDCDLKTGEIMIRNAVAYGKDGCEFYEKSPKSKNGVVNVRKVPKSEAVRRLLERRHALMVAEAGGADISQLYVCGDADGRFYNPVRLTHDWRGFAARYVGTQGRRPSFHDLRHTYATYAIAGGVDPVTVAKILGHSDPKLTMQTYADAIEGTMDAAQDAMDGILKAGAKRPWHKDDEE